MGLNGPGIASPAPQGAPLAGGDGTTSANLALLGNMAAGSFTSEGGGAILIHSDPVALTTPLLTRRWRQAEREPRGEGRSQARL